MLRRLSIKNLALLENGDIEFDSGMSALTGETGGGKSVVVTALSLLFGARAEREYIRHGAGGAAVTAEFDTSRLPKAIQSAVLQDGESDLKLERQFSHDGNGSVKINQRKATVTELRLLSDHLGEILGQHASQSLLDESNHINFLDRYGNLESVCEKVSECYRIWRKAADELTRTRKRKDQLKAERELLLFQQKEIKQAQVNPGEEAKLTAELKKLNSARTLMESAQSILDTINDEERGVAAQIAFVSQELSKMVRSDRELEEISGQLPDLSYQIEDIRRYIERYGESLVDDPERIAQINERLDELYNLKKKYGGSEEAVLEFLQNASERLGNLPDIDELLERLESDAAASFAVYAKEATALSRSRVKAARRLEAVVVKELKSLAIEQAGFQMQLLYEDDPEGIDLDDHRVKPGEFGLETGRIMFSANPGEPLKSLTKTASGGEISRLLLAIKSAEAGRSKKGGSLLVFDEVDVGIGGRTAIEVGRSLKSLSRDHQVLVVTHLHQIARQADHHYVAEKTAEEDGRTRIQVRKLGSKKDVAEELDRMLALAD